MRRAAWSPNCNLWIAGRWVCPWIKVFTPNSCMIRGISSGVTSTMSLAFIRTWARLSLRSLRASLCRVRKGRLRRMNRVIGLRR
ncbi:hypothetical protein D3C76_1402620 [compost metagenome]